MTAAAHSISQLLNFFSTLSMNFPNDGLIPIEVSARHVHLSQADQDVLFGPGYQMKIKKNLQN